MLRTPTPPPAEVPTLMPEVKIERPHCGWLHSSACPDTGVCDTCGEFETNMVLAANCGCCSLNCWLEGVQMGTRPSSPKPSCLVLCPGCDHYVYDRTPAIVISGGRFFCSSACKEKVEARYEPALKRQTSTSPAYEEEMKAKEKLKMQ